jgi:enoyl-CoA hydratase/carnithine racemase
MSESTDKPRVLVERDGPVAHVKLNRAEKRNGLDLPMFEGIVAAGREIAEDRTVRAVVLSGEGPSFCAGLDVKAMMGNHDANARILERGADSPANLAQRVGWIWREAPMPVVAALHGHVFGGGLQIALGADIRLVAADAQLSVMEMKWGIIPDMGATRTLLGLVRPDVARELTYTARVVSGEEAVALGLCTRVSADPVAEALELARTIASKNPHAIRAAKKLYEEAPFLDTRAAFELETDLQKALLGSPNQIETVMAQMQRRAPTYED